MTSREIGRLSKMIWNEIVVPGTSDHGHNGGSTMKWDHPWLTSSTKTAFRNKVRKMVEESSNKGS